ncbi:MAG: hypothetical protein JNL60_12835, partial [Bacteroidia bacterium]|nr:hypothetical protein [Bacteroidia bacterium]
MKKLILKFVYIFLLLVSDRIVSQSVLDSVPILTPNGTFDKVYDRFGNQYALYNLSIGVGRVIGTGGNTTHSISSTCVGGKFTLHYQQSSIFDLVPAMGTTACKVFSDLSNFISSTIPNGGIHIYCTDGPGGALATPYFVFPQAPSLNPNPGIVDNVVYKALVSGVDPYTNLPITSVNPLYGNFYHGALQVNPTAPWTYDVSTTAIDIDSLDAYTAILHEAMHLLGFGSAITHTNGASMFNSQLAISTGTVDNNYYTRYDLFLHDHNGNPLIVPTSTTPCSYSSYSFAPLSPTVLGMAMATFSAQNSDISNCAKAVKYIGSTTFTVYTPDSLEPGSSFSHFEDYCTHPTGTTICTGTAGNWNNFYAVMANYIDDGPCYVKRHFLEEEKKVLCDLGYSVNASYGGTAVAGSSITYTSGACNPPSIFGTNDGLSGYVYTLTTSSSSIVISYSTLLNNDLPFVGSTVTCLDLVYNNNNASLAQGANDFTVQANPGSGVVTLVYYPKNGSTVGNATYVFIYFIPAGCISCGIVSNGSFEYSNPIGNNPKCGDLHPWYRTIDCWESYYPAYVYGGVDILGTSCPNSSGQLGSYTYGTSPPVSALNLGAITNTNCIVLRHLGYGNVGTIKNTLYTSLQNGQVYQLSMWLINHGPTPGNASINTPSNPVVITLASYTTIAFTPTLNFPTGLNTLGQFTVPAGNAWTQVTQTFTYSGTAAPSIILGIDQLLTTPPSSVSPGNYKYNIFVDRVSIIPISGPTITIPTPTICSTQSFTDLGAFTGTTTGTFAGQAVTYNSTTSKYEFNISGSLPPGTYPIVFTYSNPSYSCMSSIQTAVTLTDCCLSSTLSTYTVSSVTGSVYVPGPKILANSFTIQPNAQLLLSGEYLISAGVKITVSPSSTLFLEGAHLYGCATMWEGIEILDGGHVESKYYLGSIANLIEDAETAISIVNHTTIANGIADLSDIIFNKNYIDIDITDYAVSTATLNSPIILNNCVFTCRNFTFSPTAWPEPSTGAAGLRNAITSTTGLAPPYQLNNVSIADLKSPYNGFQSHIGINVGNVGTSFTLYASPHPSTSTFDQYGIQIGSVSGGTPTADFLLFDAHETFIKSSNSNLKVINSVFQNTQDYLASGTTTANAAIEFTAGIMNTVLDLSSSSFNTGNRFWNCHRAVRVKDAYNFVMEKSIIRSEHSTSLPSSPTLALPGDGGIFINTNRFENYAINENELTNVTDAISMVFEPRSFDGQQAGFFGSATFSGTTYYYHGVYTRNLSISLNTISPQTSTSFTGSTNNYVNNGITLANLAAAAKVWSTIGIGAQIEDNLIYRSYKGISIDALNSVDIALKTDGPRKVIARNNIVVEEDLTFNSLQHGIAYTNSMPAAGTGSPGPLGQELQSIEENILSAYNPTATSISLVHAGFNGAATGTLLPAPFVICNTLSAAYQGFVFEGDDNPTFWRGNKMSGLTRGMSLLNAGEIGVQGSSVSPSDNQWTGSWSGSDALYVGTGSQAQSSPIYIRSGSPWTPPSYSGVFPATSWYNASGGTLTATGSNYACAATYTTFKPSLPDDEYDSEVQLYIAKMQAYRFLYYHEDIKHSQSYFLDFFDLQSGSSLETFTIIEDTLSAGGLNYASSLLSGMDDSGFNDVEQSYYTFYDLYIKYLTDGHLIPEDFSVLKELAGLCPGTNGAAVYKARALYLVLTGSVFNPPNPCNERVEGRAAQNQTITYDASKSWNVDLFPNPATNELNIVGKADVEELDVT